jgi:RNA polymerase sigma factor
MRGDSGVNIDILNARNRNDFIEENKKFIYKIAYSVCKRNLNWNNDDELSIALIAFNNACDNYNESKGDFHSYSKIIIRNALIDFFRKSNFTPYLVFDSEDEDLDYIDHKISMKQYDIVSENTKRAEEIALFSKELNQYGLSFNTLIDSSPSHSDTRNTLLNIAFTCSKNSEILGHLKGKKLLPIKSISLLTGANKKLLEKWRRYIIALILILSSSEYSYIKSYLNIKVGEDND